MKSALLMLSTAAIAFSAAPAFVQDAATPGAATGDDAVDSSYGKILVTAQRRSESVQDVPIAISAFNSDMVESSGSTNITSLNGLAPNVVLQTQRLVANVPMISIRGMSTADPDPDPNADPKVSTIIDGVYIPFVSSTMLDLFDVERIEILKGPQGVLFGKNNFDGEELGLTWDRYRSDMFVAGDAARSIFDYVRRDKAGGKPWFQVVGLVNPHDIMFYDATGNQADSRPHPNALGPLRREPGDPLYEVDNKFDLPESFYKDDLSTKPEAHRAIVRLNDRFYGNMPHDDEASWHRFINYYYNCLRDVDRRIGQLLWALKESGQIDNMIIIYTSDHGERAGAHGMRQKGATMYREESNSPMIVVHPDFAGGRTTKELMGAIDIAPTLISLAGMPAGGAASRFPGLPGVDVSSLLSTPAAPTERDKHGHFFNYAVAHYWEPTTVREDRGAKLPTGEPDYARQFDLSKRRLHRGVHDGRWKFARYFAPAHHHMPTDWKTLSTRNDLELYDTHADPKELVNLANDPKHRKTVLRLNAMVNALSEREIGKGIDDGREYPGPTEMYNQPG